MCVHVCACVCVCVQKASGVDDNTETQDTAEEMLTEYRLRLITGLKSYFKCRFTDGILSPQSYKVCVCE